MKRLLLFVAIIFSTTCLTSQQLSLEDKLRGQDRLDDIMEIVTAHYNDPTVDTEALPKYKHWVRWAYEMSSRTGENGKIVDVHNEVRKAWKKEDHSNNLRASAGNWSFIGPYAISGTNGSAIGIGRVDRIAFHPTDANTFYIGTPAAGILRTTNGGVTWVGLSDNMPSVAVSGIVVSHDNPNKIFILTGDGDSNINGFVENYGYLRGGSGVYVSYDQGTNWYPLGQFPGVTSYVGYDLVQHPTNANIMLAATDQGLFRTTNGGNSWTQELTGRFYDVAFQPGGNRAYATRANTFFRSTDSGDTWTSDATYNIGSPLGRIAIATTNYLSNRVYLLSGWNSGSVNGGVYISYNWGASFTRQSNSPNIISACCDGDSGSGSNTYDLALAVNQNNGDRLSTGAVRVWRSTNRGVTMINATPSCDGNADPGTCNDGAGTSSTGFVHADVHMLAYNPLNNWLYACTDGGLHRSTNDGAAWTDLSDGITASQIYHMAGSQINHNNLMIGMQDNGTKRRNSNTSIFDPVVSADGFDIIYNYNGQTTGYLTWNRTVDRFWNNGSNRTGITPPVQEWFPRVTSAVDDPTLVLAGYTDIWRSTNSGISWSNRGAAGNWDLERCPSNADKIYAAGGTSAWSTSGSMFVSTDQGLNWTTISGNSGYPISSQRITDIGVKPNNSNRVYIAMGGFSNGAKVYRSSNSGSSWVNYSSNLPNVPINAIAIDSDENVYVGTDIGVYYRPWGTSQWLPFSHRLPVVPVTDIELYLDKIRVATFGKGVWQSSLYSTCQSNITLVSNLKGNLYYEAGTKIEASGIIYGGANTDVTLKAGDHVLLKPGFTANFATRVHIYAAPCGVVIDP